MVNDLMRSVVYFHGNISPTKLWNSIPQEFKGDVVIDGSLCGDYDLADIVLKTGGSLYVLGNVYCESNINIVGDVYCKGEFTCMGTTTIEGDLYVGKEAEGLEIYVSGDLFVKEDIFIIELYVGGDIEAKFLDNYDGYTEVLGDVHFTDGFCVNV